MSPLTKGHVLRTQSQTEATGLDPCLPSAPGHLSANVAKTEIKETEGFSHGIFLRNICYCAEYLRKMDGQTYGQTDRQMDGWMD